MLQALVDNGVIRFGLGRYSHICFVISILPQQYQCLYLPATAMHENWGRTFNLPPCSLPAAVRGGPCSTHVARVQNRARCGGRRVCSKIDSIAYASCSALG
jgi:hypothetical protein